MTTIDLVKRRQTRQETVAQGDAVFEGAIYGLYAREDINHPDGRSGVLIKGRAGSYRDDR